MALDDEIDNLLHELEHCFGIEIPLDRLDEVMTAGDIHSVVRAQLGDLRTEDHHCGLMFYRLRNAISDVCGTERKRIRPDTTLESLLPPSKRRVRWEQIEAQLQLVLPDLQASQRLLTLLSYSCGATAIAVAVWCRNAWLFVPTTIVGVVFADVLSRLAAYRFPARCVTVSDLVYEAQAINRFADVLDLGPQGSWSIVQGILAEALDVPKQEVRPDTPIFALEDNKAKDRDSVAQ